MSLSNFIKTILNIQDNNISFPEEEYYQVIKKGNHLVKVFKGFLKSNYCACPHCSSKNIVKNGSRHRKIKYIPIQNYNIELELTIQRYICKDCKKTFSPSTNIVSDNSNISNNLKYTIALELKENVSLTYISKKIITALKTLKKYMKSIENIFESNITNGLIEGLNNKIKSIKRAAFGYSNFSNFKKRVLIQEGIISISA